MRIIAFLVALLLCQASPTFAQWIQQKKEDPFDGKHLFIALTAAAGYGFGLRCEAGSDQPEVLLMTPEKVDDGLTGLVNLISPKLVVIIDDLPPKSLEATLSQSDEDRLIVLSDDALVSELASALMAARRRIAVGVEAAGQKFHKTQFGVSGTKRAVGSVVNGCTPKN